MDRAAALPHRRERRARHVDFARLLGAEAWARLPEAVRRRFASRATTQAVVYRGQMLVRATWAGQCLAWLCCLIGAPVAAATGQDVPIEVHVCDRRDGGTVWERRYDFDGSRAVVSSTKRLDDDGELVEELCCGLHMRLRVYEENAALHFMSDGYFFRFGAVRLPLPAWFPPGTTHVIHEDLGEGYFRFTLRTTHRWWGEMFFQSGVFS